MFISSRSPRLWQFVPSIGFLSMAMLFTDFSFSQEPASDDSVVQIEQAALRVLRDRCLACHQEKQAEGSYRLHRRNTIHQAGDSGLAPIVAGNVEQSELFRRIISDDEAVRMPSEAPRLPDAEIEAIRRWIEVWDRIPNDDKPIMDVAGNAGAVLDTAQPPLYEAYLKSVPNPVFAWNAQSQQVYVAGVGELLVWDANRAVLSDRWTGFGRHISAIELDSTGHWLAIASGEPSRVGTVHVRNLSPGGVTRLALQLSDAPVAMAFSPTAPILALGAMDGSIKLIDVSTQQEVFSAVAHADQVLAIAWNREGTKFISGSRDRTARVYEYPSLNLKIAYSGHDRAIGGVGLVDHGSVTLDETGTLRLWAKEDSDRLLAHRLGLPQRLQPLTVFDNTIAWQEGQTIQSVLVEQREIEEEKDAEGKVKTKTVFNLVSQPAVPLPTKAVARFVRKSDSEFWFTTRDGFLHSVLKPGIAEPAPAAISPWRVYP